MWSIIKNYILVIYLTSRILFPFDQAIMFSKQENIYIVPMYLKHINNIDI